MGGGNLAVSSAVLDTNNVVTLTTAARNAAENYSVTITGVRDATFTGNFIDPNPTVCKLALELLGVGASWSYIEDNAPQSNDWFTVGFDVSTWPVGNGIFGYEDNLAGQIVTPLQQTYTNVAAMITNDVETTTFYFVTHFSGAAHAPGNELHLVGRYDDGITAYLNGVEVAREGLTLSRTSTNTAEEVHAELATGHESDTIEDITIDASGLLAGDNVLAIELHQQSLGSSDAVLGLGVYSVMAGCSPEDPTIVNNGDGTVTITWTGLGELWSSAAVDGVYAPTGLTSPAVIAAGASMEYYQVVCP
jgi:hypothetical protein